MTSHGYQDIPLPLWDKVSANHDKTSSIIFTGTCANPGKYTGAANTILNPKAGIKGFKKGSILITSMTRPEFVPLMKLAGAVVTEQGGITSHAAIVTRELNIPCLVGVQHALRAFKNGDIIEVNADLGTVKKL